MNKELILIITLNFFALFSYGQDFYDSLEVESHKTYNSSFEYIDVDSLNNVFFDANNVKMTIDAEASYQVLFTESNGFSYSGVGPCPCTYEEYLAEQMIKYLIDSTINRPKNVKKHYNSSKIFEGDELIKKAGIDFNDSTVAAFPIVHGNRDPYNGEWTVFSNEKHLIFRYVSLYYGERYSYYERLIYFKKIQ